MGILNVTPDSFSDGGEFMETAAALRQTERMIREGADIIDVGGESSRPGAQPVDAAEQIRRTRPVIASIRRRFADVVVSIDTQLAEVAEAAIAAGAAMVNDISALRTDQAMASVVADAGIRVVLMHMQGTPRSMHLRPNYDDVVGEIKTFLEERIAFAASRGIERDKIIIDPGIGFGKTVEHNLAILADVKQLVPLGPVLIGTSRKSFIGRVLAIDDPAGRLAGTVVTQTVALLAGVRILRAHDVREARHAVELITALRRRAGT